MFYSELHAQNNPYENCTLHKLHFKVLTGLYCIDTRSHDLDISTNGYKKQPYQVHLIWDVLKLPCVSKDTCVQKKTYIFNNTTISTNVKQR